MAAKQKADTLNAYAATNLINNAEWKTAHTVNADSGKVYQIVSLPNTATFDDASKVSKSYLVLVVKNDQVTGNIYEVFGNKADLAADNDKAMIEFENNTITNFTGEVSLSAWNNSIQKIKTYAQGVNTKIALLTARSANTEKVIQDNRKKVNTCIDWYWVTYYYGYVVNQVYLYTTCDHGSGSCEYTGIRDSKGTMSIRSNCNQGGGGNGNPSSFYKVYNNIRDTCLNAALTNMLNASNLNGKIADIITNVFQSSDKVNLYFQDYTNSNDSPAKTDVQNASGGVYNFSTSLNLAKIKGCSQEFATIIMVHEVLHAYMDYNNQYYQKQLKQHQEIAEKYVEGIKTYVQQLYSIDDQSAYAIIMNGLADVFKGDIPSYYETLKTKYNVSDPLSIYEFQRTGQAGTICK